MVDLHPKIYVPHLLYNLTLSNFKTVFAKTFMHGSQKNNFKLYLAFTVIDNKHVKHNVVAIAKGRNSFTKVKELRP